MRRSASSSVVPFRRTVTLPLTAPARTTFVPLWTEMALTTSPRSASTKSTDTSPEELPATLAGMGAATAGRGAAHAGPPNPSSIANPANVARADRPGRFHDWPMILPPPYLFNPRAIVHFNPRMMFAGLAYRVVPALSIARPTGGPA